MAVFSAGRAQIAERGGGDGSLPIFSAPGCSCVFREAELVPWSAEKSGKAGGE